MAGLSDILTTVQQGVTAVNNLAMQLQTINRPWTPWTPVVTANAGTIVYTSTGRFEQIGKTVFFNMGISLSSGGAGSGAILSTYPVLATLNSINVTAGRETGVTGKMLQGITAGANLLAIFNYDNSYPGGNGFQLDLSGVYEAA